MKLFLLVVLIVLLSVVDARFSQLKQQVLSAVTALPADAIDESQETCTAAFADGAVKAVNKGGITAASCKVYTVKATKELKLYRLYPKAVAYRAYGGWWTHTKPTTGTTKNQYALANAICDTEWGNTMDGLITCDFPAGTKFAVGKTESMECEVDDRGNMVVSRLLNATEEQQIFIDNYYTVPGPPGKPAVEHGVTKEPAGKCTRTDFTWPAP